MSLMVGAGAHAAPFKVLVVTVCGTGGYVHHTILTGTPHLIKWGKDRGTYTVDTANDATVFTKANLAKYSVIVLNNNTNMGGLLNSPDQRAAFLDFLNTKGVVGMHGANDTHHTWKEYDDAIGGTFSTHGIDQAMLNMEVAEKDHPINAGLKAQYSLGEEWYSFDSNPRKIAGIHVLTTLDETTCLNCTKMGDHPSSYYRIQPGGGRYFYTIVGHMDSVFTKSELFMNQVYNAILWSANQTGVGIKAGGGNRETGGLLVGMASQRFSVSEAGLTVSFKSEGLHTVEIRSLAGKRLAVRTFLGNQEFTFRNLSPHSTYVVVTSGPQGGGLQSGGPQSVHGRLVTLP
jgi:type 1 glutamine amidotransferase